MLSRRFETSSDGTLFPRDFKSSATEIITKQNLTRQLENIHRPQLEVTEWLWMSGETADQQSWSPLISCTGCLMSAGPKPDQPFTIVAACSRWIFFKAETVEMNALWTFWLIDWFAPVPYVILLPAKVISLQRRRVNDDEAGTSALQSYLL